MMVQGLDIYVCGVMYTVCILKMVQSEEEKNSTYEICSKGMCI